MIVTVNTSLCVICEAQSQESGVLRQRIGNEVHELYRRQEENLLEDCNQATPKPSCQKFLPLVRTEAHGHRM
jgi:hypothetical protein